MELEHVPNLTPHLEADHLLDINELEDEDEPDVNLGAEVESLEDVADLTNSGGQLYMKLSLLPISESSTGENGYIYVLVQLFHYDQFGTDILMAQGVVQVRGCGS